MHRSNARYRNIVPCAPFPSLYLSAAMYLNAVDIGQRNSYALSNNQNLSHLSGILLTQIIEAYSQNKILLMFSFVSAFTCLHHSSIQTHAQWNKINSSTFHAIRPPARGNLIDQVKPKTLKYSFHPNRLDHISSQTSTLGNPQERFSKGTQVNDVSRLSYTADQPDEMMVTSYILPTS